VIAAEAAEYRRGDRQAGKSPAAFRTIAEVASDLQLPAHVLRFWESKFPQIKPLKRRGGRRYYRPEDVALLRRIRSLLYTEGYTIKGVQRLLREGARTSAGAEEALLPLPEEAESEGLDAGLMPGDARVDAQELRAVLAELEALRALLRGGSV
jgi:DNA-binding transcriptional MerR regulator